VEVWQTSNLRQLRLGKEKKKTKKKETGQKYNVSAFAMQGSHEKEGNSSEE